MKKFVVITLLSVIGLQAIGQKKTKASFAKSTSAFTANIPSEVQGAWMYGNFSMTEYWSTAPRTYLGNAFTFAVAFTFNSNGTYEHYFTSSTTSGGWPVYHQSVTKGTFTVDAVTKNITTVPASAHYKRTSMGKTEEERDLRLSEINSRTSYSYATGREPNRTKAIYLTLQGTQKALTFLQK